MDAFLKCLINGYILPRLNFLPYLIEFFLFIFRKDFISQKVFDFCVELDEELFNRVHLLHQYISQLCASPGD